MIRSILFFALLLIVPAHAQRVTLLSHSAIMTTSQVSKGTLYVDCWRGKPATMASPACEVSIPLQASGAGVINANDVFDVFDTVSGPCVVTNGSGAGWSGDGGSLTGRGTGYSAIDETSQAYPTNANGITHCYNGSTDYGPIAANQAPLKASVCTDVSAAGKVSYILGSAAIGGGAARLCVWNVDTEPLATEVIDSGPNWTFLGYGSPIVDIENLDQSINSGDGNRVTFLSGLARHGPVIGAVISLGSSVAYMPCYCGLGISMDHEGNTSPDHLLEYLSPVSTVGVAADGVAWETRSTGTHAFAPVQGVHYFQEQETTDGVARCWFRTVSGQRSGMTFQFSM